MNPAFMLQHMQPGQGVLGQSGQGGGGTVGTTGGSVAPGLGMFNIPSYLQGVHWPHVNPDFFFPHKNP